MFIVYFNLYLYHIYLFIVKYKYDINKYLNAVRQDNKMDLQEEPKVSSDPVNQPEMKLVNVPITDESVALNVMVSFLSLANKRGVFGIDESAKIWECVKMFQKS